MNYANPTKNGFHLLDRSHDENFPGKWEEQEEPLRRSSSSTFSQLPMSTSLLPMRARRTGSGCCLRLPANSTFFVSLSWILNAFLFAVMTIYLLFPPSQIVPQPEQPGVCEYGPETPAGRYTSALEAIEYIPVVFQVGVGSPYQGLPNDEKDALWWDLYQKGVTMAIDEQSNSQLYNKSEKIPIPGLEHQHLGGLDVFHQLHCLDEIRMAFYPKRYGTAMVYPNGSVDYAQWLHLDHCIDSLRQSLMCHSDVSMNGFIWRDGRSKRLEHQLRNVHMCRNFSKIRDWAFSRHVDVVTDPKVLRSHVEDGVVVDYSSYPEVDLTLLIPKDWNLTVDDL